MTNALQAALYSIPADDRDTWVQMGMAIKSELGDAGFALWDAWSQRSKRYKAADARAVWRSVKPTGGITIATLYHLAKEYGWAGEAPVKTAPSDEEKRQRAEAKRREAEERNRREAEAAAKAERMLMQADYVDPRARNGRHSHEVPSAHPYLVEKGFPEQGGLVLDGNLLVPMRHYRDYHRLQSVQMIGPDGSKKFLPRGRASEAVYKIGKGAERYYCEGYATALSVRAALRHLSLDRHSEVWVCFSDGNIPKVALSSRRSMVIADNDESGAGERAAQQTGLPYWMPPEPGTDANDFALERGIDRLAVELRDLAMDKSSRLDSQLSQALVTKEDYR